MSDEKKQPVLDLDAIKKQGGDFYTNVAAAAFEVEPGAVTPDMRARVKTWLFAFTYGSPGLSAGAAGRTDTAGAPPFSLGRRPGTSPRR